MLERALLGRRQGVLRADDLSFDARISRPSIAAAEPPPSATLEELEREHILRALVAENGRVEAAARRLGIPRSTMYQKVKTFGIHVSRIRMGLPEIGPRDGKE